MEDSLSEDSLIFVVFRALTWVIPMMFSIIPHEIAHGYVALKMGDTTAKDAGRLSFNPVKHIDLYGSILLPLFLLLSHVGIVFGYAKPVPVNFMRMKSIRKGLIFVAAAGPLANFVLAGIFVFLLYMLKIYEEKESIAFIFFYMSFVRAVLVNLFLGLFNLIPMPPLDGGKILIGVLPWKMAKKVAELDGRKGMGILFLLLLCPTLFGENFDIIGIVVSAVMKLILSFPFLANL